MRSTKKQPSPTPRIEIDLDKLAHNTGVIARWCREAGLDLYAVTKGLRGDLPAARAFLAGGATGLADSRLSNFRQLQSLRGAGPGGAVVPFRLLREPAPMDAPSAVALSDAVLCASPEIMEALARTAGGRPYQIFLTIDFGDLREGVPPEDLPGFAAAAEQALVNATGQPDHRRRVHVAGVACNMACFCGVAPNRKQLADLVGLAEAASERLGRPLRVSAGNTATLPLLLEGQPLPAGLDDIRVGEGIILGRESLRREPLPGCHVDALTFWATIIEVAVKPSAPSGELAEDAFGHRPTFVDRGRRRRAIAAAGRQDIVPEGLKPLSEGIEVVGASSDHLILDIHDYPGQLGVGDQVGFYVNYACMLQAMTSPDVARVHLGQPGSD